MVADLKFELFTDIELNDPFFDSLKYDYREFETWFASKAGERAYTARGDDGQLEGFLYLKTEPEAIGDTDPPLPAVPRLKIGTFKILPHGTRLGERFMKKAFDHALSAGAKEIYVTIFPRHESLISLFQRYGFVSTGRKTSENGVELVLLRRIFVSTGDVVKDYPLIPVRDNRHFLLALYPEWHSRLLPDSILKTESASILEDVSHTNSIHKIYLTALHGVENLRPGDTIVIYRTKDSFGPAHYRSVATSLCVVESLRHISDFPSLEEFIAYCAPYSIFSHTELGTFFRKKRYPWIIRFTYNLALQRRLTRQTLIEEVGLDASSRWGFLQITTQQFRKLLSLSGHHETPIVH